MRLGLHQSARMEQRLVQSPQMIQAMQILQLSSLDLEERIEQELLENPFLELSDPEASDEPERDPASEAATDETPAPENDDDDALALGDVAGSGRICCPPSAARS